MSLFSFTPKTWHKFWKTMPETTRAQLDCLHCGGFVKYQQKTKTKSVKARKDSHPLKACSVHRITAQPDEWIIAFYSRVAEHFDFSKRCVNQNFLRRSLKCTLVHKHKKVTPVVEQWGKNFGFPMPSHQRPRIFQDHVPLRMWPCVREGGCSCRPRPTVDDNIWPPEEDTGPSPLLIVYWIMEDTQLSRVNTKLQALLKDHPGLKKSTLQALIKEMHRRGLIELHPGQLVHKSMGKRWVQVRLPKIHKCLKDYNRQRQQQFEQQQQQQDDQKAGK